MELNVSKSQVKEEMCKRWTSEAVELALLGHWDEAVQSNLKILEYAPGDIPARNRLGKAYSELGHYEKAVEAYEQALQQQPSNAIARKMLTELYALLHREPQTALTSVTEPEETDFEDDDEEELEEPIEEEEPEASTGEEGAD
jgi:tetratricopeptide (TPR) repeat protein